MNKKDYFYYFTLLFSIVALFLTLSPKISIKIFQSIKKNKFNQFNQYLLKTKDFNPQIFWQSREFFCPGYFNFDKNGLTNINFDKFNFFKKKHQILTFARYSCSYFESFESLTKENQLENLVDINLIKKNYQLLAENKEFLYFYDGINKKYYLIFLVNNKKMQRAVGFFDYKEKDKNITNDKYWLSFSIIINFY